MAKFSLKKEGKEVGPASVYAEPHDMAGKAMNEKMMKEAVTKPGSSINELNISVGNVGKRNYPPDNKHGEMKIRGTGAATKGTKARGPMA